MRMIVPVVALLATLACSDSKSPSAPTPAPGPAPAPTPTPSPTWSLTGKVTESAPTDTQIIGGATVTIADGPNAGKTTLTDAAGTYSFTNLTQATVNVDATAPGYQKKTLAVTLSSNQTATFQLPPVFKNIDDQVSDTVGTASPVCESASAAFRLPCFKYLIGAHNDGPVDAVVTWTDAAGNTTAGGTLTMELVKEPGTGANDAVATTPTTAAGRAELTATLGGGAIYSLRVLYRGGASPQPFTLHISRPN